VSSTFFTGWALLAQAPAADNGVGGNSLFQILTLVVPIGVLFWLLLIRPQRKEQAQRQTLLAAIKKNDRVVTIGGIYGVVTNVHREADEVTIKVDEATNTKLRMTLGSIARVLVDEPPAETK
jgi:preprotein translocase subunit YajC